MGQNVKNAAKTAKIASRQSGVGSPSEVPDVGQVSIWSSVVGEGCVVFDLWSFPMEGKPPS